MLLPSLALDSGIHARMTGLKIVASDKEYFLEIINTFTVSGAWELATIPSPLPPIQNSNLGLPLSKTDIFNYVYAGLLVSLA
jgi:hypothetical protein